MMETVLFILEFIKDQFIHIWPYLVITIPLAVIVRMSGISKYINRAFTGRPIISIILATLVGAFSPFCSCGVIPIVAALLIGGVPLAPVMSFWVASPSMDPEAFFLSVATIGWTLAIWRMAGTLIISLLAGFITHWIGKTGWLDGKILRETPARDIPPLKTLISVSWDKVSGLFSSRPQPEKVSPTGPAEARSSGQVAFSADLSISPVAVEPCCGEEEPVRIEEGLSVHSVPTTASANDCCGDDSAGLQIISEPVAVSLAAQSESCCGDEPEQVSFADPLPIAASLAAGGNDCCDDSSPKLEMAPPIASAAEACCETEPEAASFKQRLWKEVLSASWMVIKFMALAFFLEALITLYVPSEWIANVVGRQNPWAIVTSALMGIPVYTSNLAALPMISGLLNQGMDPAAALAFLIAGPTTTLPAMAAVRVMATDRVFVLYVAYSLLGAILLGYLSSAVFAIF
jgi:uncharacterized protein